MVRFKIAAAAAAAVACAASAANAQDADRWTVHVGPAIIAMNESATFTAGGAPVPGANVKINPQYTLEASLGYYVTPNWTLTFTGGLPTTVRVHGDGTVAPLGTLGSALYGPMTFTAEYHFNREGKFQPYVGAGAAVMLIFKTKDGAVTDLKAENDVSGAVSAGFDYMVTPKTGFYVDARNTWLKTTTTGFLGPAAVVGKVKLNPAAYSVGLVHRF
jgi:outer membrane protein